MAHLGATGQPEPRWSDDTAGGWPQRESVCICADEWTPCVRNTGWPVRSVIRTCIVQRGHERTRKFCSCNAHISTGCACSIDALVYLPILHKTFSNDNKREDINIRPSYWRMKHKLPSVCLRCTNTSTAWNTGTTSQTRDSSCYIRASLKVLHCTNLRSRQSTTATVILQI